MTVCLIQIHLKPVLLFPHSGLYSPWHCLVQIHVQKINLKMEENWMNPDQNEEMVFGQRPPIRMISQWHLILYVHQVLALNAVQLVFVHCELKLYNRLKFQMFSTETDSCLKWTLYIYSI